MQSTFWSTLGPGFYYSCTDLETMGAPDGRASQVLGTTMFGGWQALDYLGQATLAVNLGAQVITCDFIVAEIGEDEGILAYDFAMAHRIMVRPHEAAVYLPGSSEGGREDMGEACRAPSDRLQRSAQSQRKPLWYELWRVDVGASHCDPIERDCLSREREGDGDGGSRTRPTGTVSGMRGGRGRPRHQDMVGQPKVTTGRNRRGASRRYG